MTAALPSRSSALRAAPAGDLPRAPAAQARERGVLALAWPSLVENLLLQLMTMASLMMVGRLGPESLAGVGVANQVAQLLQVVFQGLSVGNTSVVARSVGARRDDDARAATRQSLLVGVALAVLLAAASVPAAPAILGLIGAAPEVAGQGAVYLRAIMLSLPLMAAALLVNGTLRGAGDTRTPMWATGAGNVSHVAVAYPLVFGVGPLPELGLAGLGIGLVAGRLVACALSVAALARRRGGPLVGTFGEPSPLLPGVRSAPPPPSATASLTPVTSPSGRGSVGLWRPDAEMLRRLFAVGGPAAAESGSVQIGMIFFSLMVLHLGTAAFAAQQIVFNAASLSMMPGLAFSVAATTLVGQRIGAGDLPGARRAGWRSTALAAGWMSLAGLFFVVLPEVMIRLYTDDPTVIADAAWGIRIVGLGQPLQAAGFVLGGALRGAGDTKTTLYVGAASMWGARLTLAYLFGIALKWGVPGIWIGWISDWSTRGLAFMWAFRRGRWARLRG